MNSTQAFNKAIRIGKRIPELEPIIMRDTSLTYRYAREIIKGRWPEGESTIILNAFYTYLYAREVIQGRWLEAEEIIAGTEYKHTYTEDFFDEPVITKDKIEPFIWERKQQVGYFAPASLFENKVSLLDMVIE